MLFLFSIPLFLFGQNSIAKKYIEPTFFIGSLGDSNSNFPNHKLQKSLFVSFGKYNRTKEWAYRLRSPKTGVAIGFTDFGNQSKLSYALTIMPYLELALFSNNRFTMYSALGGSFMNKRYDPFENPNNKGVSTKINWTFTNLFYYSIYKNTNTNWRLGLGVMHHSNGHIKKPNRGYNAVLLGVSGQFATSYSESDSTEPVLYANSSQWFYSGRVGIGQNSFSDVFNDKKEVYTLAFSGGKIINNTFKFGLGFYYKFYEHYYQYIVNEETLIKTQEPHFVNYPKWYASNIGVFGSAELVLGHIGVEMNLGVNFFKPFYKIDWQLNEGYTTFSKGKEIIVLGDLDWYYKTKRLFSSRLGLKYYLINTTSAPKHNFYVGAFINANLGQADFSEFSLGYVHRFAL